MDIKSYRLKISEANFFLELITALEKRGNSLTHHDNPDEEASFLLSAVLNTLYSATEMLGGKQEPMVKKFRESHPLFYAGSGKGGLRNTTVHVTHVEAASLGRLPQKSPGSVRLNFERTPKLIQEKATSQGRLTLNFTPIFVVEIDGQIGRAHV